MGALLLPSILMGVGAAGSVLGGLFGKGKAARAAKRQRQLIERQIGELSKWREKEVHQDFLKSNIARDAIKRSKQLFTDRSKQARNIAAVTGGTQESKLASQAQNNRALTDMMSQLASYGTQRKAGVEQQYRSSLASLLGQQGQMLGRDVQSGQNLASGAVDLFSQLASLYGAGALGGAAGNLGGQTGVNAATKTARVARAAGAAGGINY